MGQVPLVLGAAMGRFRRFKPALAGCRLARECSADARLFAGECYSRNPVGGEGELRLDVRDVYFFAK